MASRDQTGLPVSSVVGAGRRLTEAGLTIARADGASWRTDFESLCRAANVERAALSADAAQAASAPTGPESPRCSGSGYVDRVDG